MESRFVPVALSKNPRNGHVAVILLLDDEIVVRNKEPARIDPRAPGDVFVSLPIELWFSKPIKHVG